MTYIEFKLLLYRKINIMRPEDGINIVIKKLKNIDYYIILLRVLLIANPMATTLDNLSMISRNIFNEKKNFSLIE